MKNMVCSKLLKPACRQFLSNTPNRKCTYGTKGQLLIKNLFNKSGVDIPQPSPNTQHLLNKSHNVLDLFY